MPEIVDPTIHSQELAQKESKHKYLGQYIVQMSQVQQGAQENISMIVRQMKGKVNQSTEKVQTLDEQIRGKIQLMNQKLDEGKTEQEALQTAFEQKKKNVEELQEKLKGFIEGQFSKMKTGHKDLKQESKEARKDLNFLIK